MIPRQWLDALLSYVLVRTPPTYNIRCCFCCYMLYSATPMCGGNSEENNDKYQHQPERGGLPVRASRSPKRCIALTGTLKASPAALR
jgi:hypothetical protein